VNAVAVHHGAGGFNPFIHPQMGWSYVVFNAFVNLAAVLTWQTVVQRILAAKDAKVGQSIYKRHQFFFRVPIPHTRYLGDCRISDRGPRSRR
jgi:SSS family solute:Na+ symporter